MSVGLVGLIVLDGVIFGIFEGNELEISVVIGMSRIL